MAYTREWIPKAVDITKAQTIQITTWDGRSVPGLNYFISGNALVIAVPYPNKYKITVFSGSDSETARIYVPENVPSTLELRLHQYIDEILEDYVPSDPSAPVNIAQDPDNEGYFIYTNPTA